MNVQLAPQWLPSLLIPFVTLSYPTLRPAEPDSFSNSDYYATGLLDVCFVVTCIAVMAVLRDVARIYLLEPFAQWFITRQVHQEPNGHVMANGAANSHANGLANGSANGHANGLANGSANGHANGSANGHIYAPVAEKNDRIYRKGQRQEHQARRSVLRFAEQGWSVIYYSIQWAFGVYIHCNLPTAPFKPERLWLNYPHIPLSGPLKFYYLTQTSFYIHQVLILNAEARRKDHMLMMTHHVITIALMVAGYFYNFTRVGCLIMVLMDWCDIWLPLAKMFRYLSLNKLTEITFTFFMASWLVTRHYLFIRVIHSAYSDAPRLIAYDWDPERGHYLTYEVYLAFVGMLISLQLIQLPWSAMICGVAWRVISGQGAEDTRSDDEGDVDDSPLQNATEKPRSDLKKRR